ncbi:hypothetical protein PFISCL1PPCAC_25483, partial [Pristionchus fissidentatus]
ALSSRVPPFYFGDKKVEKRDLCAVTTVETPMSSLMGNHTKCFLCGQRDDNSLELSLFALYCGHFACRACWLEHCRWA